MRQMKFLVVEDNDADIYHLNRVLETMEVNFKLSILRDGESAVKFLSNLEPYAKARSPDLIFLDLNLPRLSGVEVLESLTAAQCPPVCILTGSNDERDRLKKRFGIRRIAYIVKPATREMILNCFRCYTHLAPIAEEISARNLGGVAGAERNATPGQANPTHFMAGSIPHELGLKAK